MKLVLTYPSYFPTVAGPQFPSPPLAIYVLGAIAKEAGFKVEVVDPSRYGLRIRQRQIVEELIRDVDVVGISATSLNWHEAFRLIGNIKELNQDIKVIVGGVHATHCDQHILENTQADYVVRGEAEHTFSMLLQALAEGREPSGIPGVSFKSDKDGMVRNPPGNKPIGNGVNNDIEPLYGLMPENLYSVFPLETSRGCPNSCAFCSIPYRRQWKGRDPAKVLDRLENINNFYIHKMKGNCILFVDDCFTASTKHVRQICDGINERGFTNSFVIEARITDLLNPAVFASVASLNLAQIQVGIECGYDEGLRMVDKTGLTISKVKECARRLRENDIISKVMLSFILGLPWEGEDQCLQTVDFAAELVSNFGGFVNFSWWLLLPSRLWESRYSYGIDIDEHFFDIPEWNTDDTFFFKTHPGISQETIQRVRERVYDYRRQGLALCGI